MSKVNFKEFLRKEKGVKKMECAIGAIGAIGTFILATLLFCLIIWTIRTFTLMTCPDYQEHQPTEWELAWELVQTDPKKLVGVESSCLTEGPYKGCYMEYYGYCRHCHRFLKPRNPVVL